MSLIPFFADLYSHRPSRLLDQHFGHPLFHDDIHETPGYLARTNAGYLRNWRSLASQDVGSTVSLDKDRFQANLDVQQFKPEEITVKLSGERTITIEGKHEEKPDEHGYISRHFVRKYVLPKNCNIDHVESKLSSDGVLSITAPTLDSKQLQHKHIPITHTGEPARVEKKQPEAVKGAEKK